MRRRDGPASRGGEMRVLEMPILTDQKDGMYVSFAEMDLKSKKHEALSGNIAPTYIKSTYLVCKDADENAW